MPLSRHAISFALLAWTSAVAAEPAMLTTYEDEWIGFTVPPTHIQADGGEDRVATPKVAYLHNRFLQVVASPGTDKIWAEDVHLTDAGMLTSLWVAYYMDPELREFVHMRLWVYENDAEDTMAPDPEKALLGPIEFLLVPPRDSRVPAYRYNLLDPIPVGKDLWLAVQFTHDSPGLVVADGEPHVGTTHDVYYDFATGTTTQLPEPFLSNFIFEVRVDPVTAVQDMTWSGIKALYAGDGPTPPTR